MGSPVIRRIGVADAERAGPVFDRYRRFYGQPADRAKAEIFLAERLENGESAVFLAEDEAGGILGFAQVYPTFSSVRAAPVLILNDLFVEEHARRGGVARALVEAVEEMARETGAAGLSLSTARDNHPAQALYRAMGWREDERFVTFTRTLDE